MLAAKSPCFSVLRARQSYLLLFNHHSRNSSQSSFTFKSQPLVSKKDDIIPNDALRGAENYDARNKRLNRPLSPHMTIYKWPSNMVESIAHRITGMTLSGLLYGLAFGAVLLPEYYPYYLDIISNRADLWMIFGFKFLFVAFPFCYHSINGIRHLHWDSGYGFTIKQINKSGNMVVGLSIMAAFLATTLL